MHKQFRSPTRKPVDTRPPMNFSQPQRKMTAPTGGVPAGAAASNEQLPMEQSMGRMRMDDDDDETDDFGLVGASAERSPGRISGRNRDTAMFDPMGKRATYLPYGGFDSIIDEYYTEGDPSGIALPAPSQLQRREQSQSPVRAPIMPTSPRKESLQEGEGRRGSDIRLRPNLPRHNSGASAQSSKAGSLHGTSPNRPADNHGFGGREEMAHREHGAPAISGQYYDDEPYYVNETASQQRSAPYPAEMSIQSQPPTNNYYDDGHAYSDRGTGPRPGLEQQQVRGRYDESRSAPYQHNNASHKQRGPPPLRGQNSMEFQSQGRQRDPYPNGPPQDQRRRDPRAMQQDPRLAPQTMQDPRARQGYPPRQQIQPPPQQQRPPNQNVRDDRMNSRGGPMGQGEGPLDPRQRPPQQHFQQQPSRDTRGGPGYPPGPSNPSRRPMQAAGNFEAPLERMRSPPEQRAPDMRMHQEQRRGSPGPGYRDQRGPSPSQQQQQQRSLAQNGMQRPPAQQHQQQPLAPQVPQPMAQAPSQQRQPPPQQAPQSKIADRRSDTTDMAMHPEPTRPVTLQEIAQLRKEAAKNNSPQLQLTLVKKLMEAATVLAAEGGKADAKQTKKNRDDYNREALRTLKQITAQEKPFPEAVFFLANCYGNASLSLEVDHERAFTLYEQAAKLQHPASAYRTAVCLEIGAGTRQDVERAVRFYRRAAEYGDAAAMYKIGMILLRGLLSQPPDARQALVWLQKAAEKADIDNPHALHELALLYEKGDGAAGIAQDESHAKELFTRAAKLHYAPSQYRLGYAYEYGTLGCPVDPRRSIAWFSRGAERGDPESELSLSGWYLTGSEGILAQNDREAYLWGRKAAEKGLAKAEFAVGYFFESGIGTNVDLEEAVKWYKRAATAGQKKAQERLLALGKRKR